MQERKKNKISNKNKHILGRAASGDVLCITDIAKKKDTQNNTKRNKNKQNKTKRKSNKHAHRPASTGHFPYRFVCCHLIWQG